MIIRLIINLSHVSKKADYLGVKTHNPFSGLWSNLQSACSGQLKGRNIINHVNPVN